MQNLFNITSNFLLKTTKIKLNSFTLNFTNPDLEKKFRLKYFEKSIPILRISLLTTILLYAAFGLLDNTTSEYVSREFYLIRYVIVIPLVILLIIISYNKHFIKMWQSLIAFGLIVSGSGIIYMLHRNPDNLYYYGGMFLIFMGGYFYIKLRFSMAVFSGFSLIFIYTIIPFIFTNTLNTPINKLIIADSFFIAANIICMIGLYNIERLQRIEFYQKLLLSDKQSEIINVNHSLEKQVKERTKLLDERNKILIQEIDNRKEIERQLVISKEKAEESDRLKSAFLANMSHEIRTPMNGIIGFTSLLTEPGLSGSKKDKYIKIIQKSGNRMLNTVNDIIEVSKIETGQVSKFISSINVNLLIEELFNFFKLEVEKKGIELNYSTAFENDDATISTDGLMFNSILTNLIKNAIKYTEEGSINFGYHIKDNLLEFFVKDTGIGISKERQQAIFERFVQADIEDKRAHQGSGLGLAIAKTYVQILGGEIWLESETEKGSSFFFTHPIVKEKNSLAKKTNEEIQLKSFNGKKLLIVEDEQTIYEYLDAVLSDFDLQLEWVQNGEEAVNYCKENSKIDLVLMDIKMPIMNGYEATRIIKKIRPNLPIIAQTAFAMVGDSEKMIKAGCSDYISKPIDKNKLIKIISKYLNYL